MTTSDLRRTFHLTPTQLRKLSNVLILVGYYILLNVDLTTGVIIRIIASALVLPWLVENKVWDGIGVLSVMTSIEIHKLILTLFF